MKRFYIALIAIFALVFTTNAQKAKVSQNFENLEKGTDILTLQKGKFNT